MEFLNKPGLWMFAALAPLVALYILRVKRERKTIGSTLLWKAAHRDLLAKHPFKRLSPEIPLLLQIAALSLLALALAKPASYSQNIKGEHIAFVVDVSASMAVTSMAPSAGGNPVPVSRMDRAKATLHDSIQHLSPNSDAFIVVAGREAKLVSTVERDQRRLHALVDRLVVEEVEGDLRAGVGLAFERLRHVTGERTLVVVSDGALADRTPIAVTDIPVKVLSVGDSMADNVGIVKLDVRSGNDPVTRQNIAQAFVLLRNYGPGAKEVYVAANVEGERSPVATRKVLVPAREKLPVVLSFDTTPMNAGKGLTVTVTTNDAFPTDDAAYARVPYGTSLPVTFAHDRPSSWIGRVLESDPNIELQDLKLAELSLVNVDPLSFVVVEGGCPEEVPGLDALVVGPPPGPCLGFTVGGETKQPEVTSWETSDPRFRFLSFDGVHFARANPIQFEGGHVSLLRARTGHLAVDASTPGRQITLLGFDVGETDWPLKASFVVFMRNVLDLARTHRSYGTSKPARTGEALRIPVPQKVTTVFLRSATEPEQEFRAQGGFAIVPPLPKAGLYEIRWTKPTIYRTTVAVNLVSENESNIQSGTVPILLNDQPVVTAQGVERSNDWTSLLATIGLAFLLFDLYWYTRRPKRLSGASS